MKIRRALLTVLVIAGGMTVLPALMIVGASRGGLFAQQETDTGPTPTPYVLPADFVPSTRCPGVDIVPRLILHERGRVRDEENDTPLRLRSAPDTTNAKNILTQIPVNGVFLVLNGPLCGQTYLWYFVRYRDRMGWIAEGQDDIYFTEPYLPG